jgi:hypothetical protein
MFTERQYVVPLECYKVHVHDNYVLLLTLDGWAGLTFLSLWRYFLEWNQKYLETWMSSLVKKIRLS